MRLKIKLRLSYRSDRYLGGEVKKNIYIYSCTWNNLADTKGSCALQEKKKPDSSSA